MCVCVRAHNVHTETSTGMSKKSKKQHPSASVSPSLSSLFSFTSLSPFGSKPGLTYPIPQQNTHTHYSAGTYTVSELQRHPAVGVEVHFLKLWFPSAYKCYRRTEKLTTLVSWTRKLFMKGYIVKEDCHGCSGMIISSPVKQNFNLKLARDHLEEMERGKTGNIEMKT